MDLVTRSRLRPILETALEHDPAERQAFMRAACGDDERLEQRALELPRNEEPGSVLLDDTTPLGSCAAADAGVPAPRERLGPWWLERILGLGGMGAVWPSTRADASFTQRVAVKRVRGDLAGATMTVGVGPFAWATSATASKPTATWPAAPWGTATSATPAP